MRNREPREKLSPSHSRCGARGLPKAPKCNADPRLMRGEKR
ncbi:MAG: hypothetical protein QXU78_03685 [Sulfolobales archaeon]